MHSLLSWKETYSFFILKVVFKDGQITPNCVTRIWIWLPPGQGWLQNQYLLMAKMACIIKVMLGLLCIHMPSWCVSVKVHLRILHKLCGFGKHMVSSFSYEGARKYIRSSWWFELEFCCHHKFIFPSWTDMNMTHSDDCAAAKITIHLQCLQIIATSLSSCAVNNQQNLTRHVLRCDFLCILHQEVHGLASSASMTILPKAAKIFWGHDLGSSVGSCVQLLLIDPGTNLQSKDKTGWAYFLSSCQDIKMACWDKCPVIFVHKHYWAQ